MVYCRITVGIVASLKSADQQRIQRGDIRVTNSTYTTLSGLRTWQHIYYDYTSGKSMKGLVAVTQKRLLLMGKIRG